jgi:hypothetical protein
MVLDRDLRVIAASRSFYRTFAAEPRNTQGRKLYELGDGQWNIPALRTVLEDVARIWALVEPPSFLPRSTVARRIRLGGPPRVSIVADVRYHAHANQVWPRGLTVCRGAFPGP